VDERPQGVVRVSRRIHVSPPVIFEVLVTPSRHSEFDGSGMLRGSSQVVVNKVGDTFSMKMNLPDYGDYEMMNVVVDYELNRRIAWEPRPGDQAAVTIGGLAIGAKQGYRWMFELVPDGLDATVVTECFDCSDAPAEIRDAVSDGESWLDAMTESLMKLDKICTANP
jgi:uncharacterized protein YndB with AHSA1/START domain